MIPKIIHYCWYGKNEKSEKMKKCIKSWEKLKGYKIIEWNEENCDLEENQFIKEAIGEKKWAFVSDYFRLKVLYEYGGIYLDTDVEIKKEFDEDMLKDEVLLCFEYDSVISTAIIGAEKKNLIIKELLDNYTFKRFDNKENNNKLFTDKAIKEFKGFRLNGEEQKLSNGVHIYSKDYFTCPSLKKDRGFSIHHFEGTWIEKSEFAKKRKKILKMIIPQYIYLNLVRYIALKKSLYYDTYLKYKNIK